MNAIIDSLETLETVPSFCGMDSAAMLPQVIAGRIEAVRQERLRSYADFPLRHKGEHLVTETTPTALEMRVDELLDALHTLHRLEHLADYAAKGNQIVVDADRLLIAEYETTYAHLLKRARAVVAAEYTLSRLMPIVPNF